ncbi:urea transporter [Mucilaginibacter calamicampi]|uniref:Urea transporter n=1 Tax=Mucilaginibacter calamicampi TaxID=1302352 RepID=A0ABW2YU12_9SPHI
MKSKVLYYYKAIINSYAILFFSQSRVLGILLLVVSFFNAAAGLTGLAGTCIAVAMVTMMGYDRVSAQTGVYSFNVLLLGIAFGTFYQFNITYWLWFIVACLLVVSITIVLTGLLGKYGLPVLSLPFIITFWIILAAANGSGAMGLQQKESYMLVELNIGGEPFIAWVLSAWDVGFLPKYPDLFFRSLSSIFFQNSVIAGVIMSIGLFIHSRIGFSLLVVGFAAACIFNQLTGFYPDGISHYHLGANFIMISLAIGGFFLIPSYRSFLWAIVTIPLAFLIVNAFTKLLGAYNLPVFSLPFAVLTITLLYFFMLRVIPGKLKLTPIQHYSPETNLYQYLNGQERLHDLKYLRLNLPFVGTWTVSQGYDGGITHQDEWSKALDFVITDEDNNTYRDTGTRPEHFYCFNKPVLACADGVVEEVVSHIEDNAIGVVNTGQNWGNTVVIKHITGIYTKASHLKQHSIKVKIGDYVRQGDMLGLCGNSGRSPEPHLHFQVQVTPYIGSKTLAYPFAYYINSKTDLKDLKSFETPAEGTQVHPVDLSTQLKQAFTWQPGYNAQLTGADGRTERVEVYTDAYNSTHLTSKESGASIYFINNGTVCYFTSFYGDERSLLYYFYLAAYKVVFTADSDITANDVYPLQAKGFSLSIWLHDLLAPFYQFMRYSYQSKTNYQQQQLVVAAKGYKEVFNKKKQVMDANIFIADNEIRSFEINLNGKNTTVKWQTENIF